MPSNWIRDEYRRFGGELPLGCDPRLSWPCLEPETALGFSHGRAALDWLIGRRGPFAAALVCAYTCPTVPRFLESRALAIGRFDVAAPLEALTEAAAALPGRVLVLVPALFGFDPWLDATALAESLGPRALVVIDAAQTAFGHRRYRPPPGGAVLACPRKTTAAADGAWLALDGVTEADRRTVDGLPEATRAAGAKQAARALLAARDPALEARALALVQEAEAGWPDQPCRIGGDSRTLLATLDARAHETRRLANRARLRARLDSVLPAAADGDGVPFCHAVLTDVRAGLLARLRSRRVFATALWPDADPDPDRHPGATRLARRLLALPVDQRYDLSDMDRLADLVLESVADSTQAESVLDVSTSKAISIRWGDNH